jgi:hypothetical protein
MPLGLEGAHRLFGAGTEDGGLVTARKTQPGETFLNIADRG